MGWTLFATRLHRSANDDESEAEGEGSKGALFLKGSLRSRRYTSSR